MLTGAWLSEREAALGCAKELLNVGDPHSTKHLYIAVRFLYAGHGWKKSSGQRLSEPQKMDICVVADVVLQILHCPPIYRSLASVAEALPSLLIKLIEMSPLFVAEPLSCRDPEMHIKWKQTQLDKVVQQLTDNQKFGEAAEMGQRCMYIPHCHLTPGSKAVDLQDEAKIPSSTDRQLMMCQGGDAWHTQQLLRSWLAFTVADGLTGVGDTKKCELLCLEYPAGGDSVSTQVVDILLRPKARVEAWEFVEIDQRPVVIAIKPGNNSNERVYFFDRENNTHTTAREWSAAVFDQLPDYLKKVS